MANTSDALLSQLESISWMYSINCQINGQNNTLLIKYKICDDFYAVMVTDLTQTYFECLDGKDIDEHYRRFNKGEVQRKTLIKHLKGLLLDVTKAEEWDFKTLEVDCHTSRLTLKVKNQLSVLKFEWSFYMISTNPETLSRHLTLPLLRLVSSLRHGVDVLRKEIKNKDKLLEQLDSNNSKIETSSSDQWLIDRMCSNGTDEKTLINNLVEDSIIHSILEKADKMSINSEPNSVNNSQIIVQQLDDNTNEDQMSRTAEMESQLIAEPEPQRRSPTRQTNKSKKLKL